MKCFIIFLTLYIGANSLSKELQETWVTRIKTEGAKCADSAKADHKEVQNILDHISPQTYEGKCMLFCLHQEFKVQNSDGTITLETTDETLLELKKDDPGLFNNLMEVATVCQNEHVQINADPCITASDFAECVFRDIKKRGITSEIFEFK